MSESSFIQAMAGSKKCFQNGRTRESSVAISPDWAMLEEVEFHRLAKLRLEVDEPENLYVTSCLLHRLTVQLRVFCSDTYGRVFPYEKSYDRITTKSEKPLQLLDRIKYNPTTSDDPVIQEVCRAGHVYRLPINCAT